ncbi:MAG TPA: hypothetical protein VGN37_00410 [Actinocatenispora sp.]
MALQTDTDGDQGGAPVKPGHLPVSEMFSDRAGAGSPFGEELTFPLPADRIVYRLPSEHDSV